MQRLSKTTRVFAAAGLMAGVLALTGAAQAAESEAELLSRPWQHEGLFGTFDRSAAQRGLQVYREVCSSCHGLEYVAFRNLEALGFSEDAVDAIAADYTVEDGPDDEGQMFDREGRASDHFPSPYANPQEAAFVNGGAAPPDLSVVIKAREGGADYVYSLLRGYEDPPPDIEVREGSYYNEYFPGHWLAMPPPLYEEGVEYADGTPATVEQMASDVAVFLSWAAEPKLEERKQTGLKVLLFLIILTALFYATKRVVWADAH